MDVVEPTSVCLCSFNRTLPTTVINDYIKLHSPKCKLFQIFGDCNPRGVPPPPPPTAAAGTGWSPQITTTTTIDCSPRSKLSKKSVSYCRIMQFASLSLSLPLLIISTGFTVHPPLKSGVATFVPGDSSKDRSCQERKKRYIFECELCLRGKKNCTPH